MRDCRAKALAGLLSVGQDQNMNIRLPRPVYIILNQDSDAHSITRDTIKYELASWIVSIQSFRDFIRAIN